MKLYREIKVDPNNEDDTVTLTDTVYDEDVVHQMVDDGIYTMRGHNGMAEHLTEERFLIPCVTEDEVEETVIKIFKLKKETEEK